jgi:hypothetical protein
MKKAYHSIIVGLLLSAVLISCSKSSTGWAGTYNGTGQTNTVNRVVINDAGSGKVQLLLQTNSGNVYYTYVTIQGAAVAGTTATINENGLILGYTDTYHFTGSAVLAGNSLVVSGSGTSTTNSSDVKYYYFSGSR